MPPATPILAADTCEAGFRQIALSCAQSIDAALVLFRETDDPAGPHKARVALRRLTTALDAFEPILRREAAADLRDMAKTIFRELGKLRDSDVHLATATRDTTAKDRLARNQKLRHKARSRLAKPRIAGFAQALRLAVAVDGPVFRRSGVAQARRNGPLAGFAGEILSASWQACRAYGPSVRAIPDTKRHEFRKDMKTMRYLAEFFAAAFPRLQDDSFHDDFRDIQDALGDLNDFFVALALERRKLPAELPPPADAALARADAIWARLYASRAPWQDQSPGADLAASAVR